LKSIVPTDHDRKALGHRKTFSACHVLLNQPIAESTGFSFLGAHVNHALLPLLPPVCRDNRFDDGKMKRIMPILNQSLAGR
jgi:hypothetical protein